MLIKKFDLMFNPTSGRNVNSTNCSVWNFNKVNVAAGRWKKLMMRRCYHFWHFFFVASSSPSFNLSFIFVKHLWEIYGDSDPDATKYSAWLTLTKTIFFPLTWNSNKKFYLQSNRYIGSLRLKCGITQKNPLAIIVKFIKLIKEHFCDLFQFYLRFIYFVFFKLNCENGGGIDEFI